MSSRQAAQFAPSCPASLAPPFVEYFETLMKAPPFEASPRRAALLRYLVKKSLAGEAGSLNEYAIALEVFGKPESFDQRIDSSVRSEISRLRKVVSSYYEGLGAEDRWRIVFPTRGYVPQVEQVSAGVPEPAAAQTIGKSAAFRHRRLIAFAVVLCVILVVALQQWKHRAVRKSSDSVAEGEPEVRPAVHTLSPEAQALYLKGQYYWEHRTEKNLQKAIDVYTQAIVADSDYAEAYAGLAECYDLMPEYSSMAQREAFSRAIAAANKALALDPTNSVAHRALAFGLFWSQRDQRRAFAEFRKAIQLSPNDAEVHHWYATALNSAHQPAEAKQEIDRAQQLAPASRAILADQAWIGYWIGDSQAVAKLQELEATEPDFSSPPQFLARIDLSSGNYPGYLDQINRAASLSTNSEQKRLAAAAKKGFASSGVVGMLHALKTVQLQAFAKGQSDGYELAHTCGLLGEKHETIHYLQAAFVAKDIFLLDVSDPNWAPALNGYPSFEAFRQQIRTQFTATSPDGMHRNHRGNDVGEE